MSAGSAAARALPREPTAHPDADPGPAALMDCLMGFVRTHALRAALAAGLPEALGERAMSAAELAAACGTEPRAMLRLARCLAEAGTLVQTADGRFALSAWGHGLRAGVPGSARAYIEYVVDHVAPSARHLPELLRSGRAGAPFERENGRDFFAHFAGDPTAGAAFDAAMAATLAAVRAAVVEQDWAGVASVVDVGGGNGSLLAALLGRHRHLRGVLAEQPHVLPGAARVLDAAGVTGRVRLQECDFFTAVPAGADRYLLARVLHDWDDGSALRVLAAVRAALPPHGRLQVVELVLGRDSGWTMAYDLMMGMLLPGHERTAAEWRALLGEAGLVLERIDPAGWRGSILTCRAAPTEPGLRA
ncbi:methyltransferase [Pseudonocardia lacus]|uniref:methyltransferase n=1 Tax=Pseudonocardia lacus TaxID=2835865 RepID=UPI001BDCB3A4|nr:methyltransferase [Pseudonocardia lacus]